MKAGNLPKYVNMLEDLQKQALCIDLKDPIPNRTAMKLTALNFMKSDQYPRLEED